VDRVSTDVSAHVDAESGSVQSLATPVDPAELAAATLAHQASLDVDVVPAARLRQQLAGRDAGSLSAVKQNGRAFLDLARTEKSVAQPSLAHAAGEVANIICSFS